MCSKVRIKCNPALWHSGSVSIIIPIFEKPTESMRSLSTVPVRRRLVGAEKVGVETLNWIVDNIFHFSLLQFNLQLVCVPLILVLLLDRRERLHYNTSRVLLLIILQLLLPCAAAFPALASSFAYGKANEVGHMWTFKYWKLYLLAI